jgi:hypothetical protein
MKKLVSLTIALLFISSVALAQDQGSIGIFVDQLGTDCNVIDAGPPGITPIYVLHVGTVGSQASRWMFEIGPLVTMAYTGESSPFPAVIGNTQTGINVAYGSCQSGNFLIATVNMFGQGTSPACGLFSIVPDTAVAAGGTVNLVDCGFVVHRFTKGGQARINPDITCMCNVAIKESTWGRLKAIYTE